MWLAEQGWEVTAVDVSPVGLAMGEGHAVRAGVEVRWIEADLAAWTTEETFALVCSMFLHSPLSFDRPAVLRRGAGRVAPEGVLCVVGHATTPPWSWKQHDHEHDPLPRAAETLASLELADAAWEVDECAEVPRTVTGPDAEEAEILDAVLRARRRSS